MFLLISAFIAIRFGYFRVKLLDNTSVDFALGASDTGETVLDKIGKLISLSEVGVLDMLKLVWCLVKCEELQLCSLC